MYCLLTQYTFITYIYLFSKGVQIKFLVLKWSRLLYSVILLSVYYYYQWRKDNIYYVNTVLDHDGQVIIKEESYHLLHTICTGGKAHGGKSIYREIADVNLSALLHSIKNLTWRYIIDKIELWWSSKRATDFKKEIWKYYVNIKVLMCIGYNRRVHYI